MAISLLNKFNTVSYKTIAGAVFIHMTVMILMAWGLTFIPWVEMVYWYGLLALIGTGFILVLILIISLFKSVGSKSYLVSSLLPSLFLAWTSYDPRWLTSNFPSEGIVSWLAAGVSGLILCLVGTVPLIQSLRKKQPDKMILLGFAISTWPLLVFLISMFPVPWYLPWLPAFPLALLIIFGYAKVA